MSDPPESSMKIVIKEVVGTASWHWLANDETCGICQFPFIASCPNCTYPGDKCRLVTGVCSHAFHMHCLASWLMAPQAKNQCPLCRQKWKMQN